MNAAITDREGYLDTVARLLLTPDALSTLSMADARAVVGYMLLTQYPQGTVIFRANAQERSDFMLLVLDGEVAVETPSSGNSSVVVDVLGRGHLIGEMGVLDGSARSATCIAQNSVRVGMLSRPDMERLLEEHPPIAARFLLSIAKRLADRLRSGNHKLLVMSQVNLALQKELDELYSKMAGKKASPRQTHSRARAVKPSQESPPLHPYGVPSGAPLRAHSLLHGH